MGHPVYARKDDARNIKRLTRVCRDIAWLGHLSVVSYRALNVHNFTIIIARITYVSSVCRLRANKGWSRNRARGFSGAGAPGTRKVSRYVDPVVARKWNQIFSKARVPYAIRAQKKKKEKGKDAGHRESTKWSLILIYVSTRERTIGISSSPVLYLPVIDPFPARLYITVFRYYRASMSARDRPTDKFTSSSGGIMRRERSPTMEDSGGEGERMEGLGRAPRRFPVLAHNPQHFSWDSEACAPVRPLGAPWHQEIKASFSRRGSVLYIFRYKFGRGLLVFSCARASLQLSYLNYVTPLFHLFFQ